MNTHLTRLFLSIVILAILAGCSDMGSDPPKTSAPQINLLQPDSASAGDTLRILGTNFGATKGTNTVTVGGASADTVYLWSTTEIRVKVPATAANGNVVVTVGGTASTAKAFNLRTGTAAAISFAANVFPVFQNSGCTNCHGGNGGFFLDTYAHLMSGTSDHGPAVTPGNGEGSVIIKKLRGTAAFGARMPQNGPPYLSNATIAQISTWITQGALNN